MLFRFAQIKDAIIFSRLANSSLVAVVFSFLFFPVGLLEALRPQSDHFVSSRFHLIYVQREGTSMGVLKDAGRKRLKRKCYTRITSDC